MKKIAAAMAMVMVLTGCASTQSIPREERREVIITFSDGSKVEAHTVKGLSDSEVFQDIAYTFPGKRVIRVEDRPPGPSTTVKVIEGVLTVVLLVVLIRSLSGMAKSKPCMNPGDIARDGSRCGLRAASVRPGGY